MKVWWEHTRRCATNWKEYTVKLQNSPGPSGFRTKTQQILKILREGTSEEQGQSVDLSHVVTEN